MKDKKFILGQYFTKKGIVDRVIDLLLDYKNYNKNIEILEPSSGTGNFVESLREKGFNNIRECEIDNELTDNPEDFFEYGLNNKFNLIIGNPPFTKYNVKKSYFYPKKYEEKEIKPRRYLSRNLLNMEKIQVEKAFILKSLEHLKDENSSIGFVLPISFFIGGRNRETKKKIREKFSTVIIYQNDKSWFDYPIPCCFAIFTNLEEYEGKILLLYEDDKKINEIEDMSKLIEKELIPKSYIYKENNHQKGTPLSEFLKEKTPKYRKNYGENNISAGNILENQEIPEEEEVSKYHLAVARVGNASVGRSGLINIEEDILNDMFYVFSFKKEYNEDKALKEEVVKKINENQDHFKNLSVRVGSKSIKKKDIFKFRVNLGED